MDITKPRSRRWWMPISTVLLAITALFGWWHYPELPVVSRIMYSGLTVAVSLLLLLVWFLFLSAFRWRTRLLSLGILVLAVFGFSRLVRTDGAINGSGLPRVTWKWAPKNSGEVDQSKAIATKSALPEDVPTAGGDYPGFLGSDRSGIVQGVQLERDWSAHPPQVLWRQPVGLAWSSFAVMGSRAITQEQRGENELVVCYELATGRTLWMHTNQVRFNEKLGGDGPRATPTIDGDRVFALGATGILDCLELAGGKAIWSHDTLGENHASNLVFGKSSSPLVLDNLVIISGGLTNGPTLLAYQRENGAPAWTAGTEEASYSSPTVATLAGRRQVLSLNAASFTAHDPADGQILWRYSWKGWGPRCAQPVAIEGDRVLLSAGFGLGSLLLQVKADASGKLSAAEVWKNLRLKTQFASAVVRGGYAYGLDEGVLACIDLATGERKWKDGHYGFGQLVFVHDLLLVQTEPGPLALVEATPAEFRELGRVNALDSKTWNPPALAGDFLLVRNDKEAICFKLATRTPAVKMAGAIGH
jgi:outer membrane protein assembly factor BamB